MTEKIKLNQIAQTVFTSAREISGKEPNHSTHPNINSFPYINSQLIEISRKLNKKIH